MAKVITIEGHENLGGDAPAREASYQGVTRLLPGGFQLDSWLEAILVNG